MSLHSGPSQRCVFNYGRWLSVRVKELAPGPNSVDRVHRYAAMSHLVRRPYLTDLEAFTRIWLRSRRRLWRVQLKRLPD